MDDLVGSLESFEQGALGLNWPEHMAGDPAAGVETGMLDAGKPSTQLYGACSIETYRAAGALHAAHRDAGGFLDAVDSFAAPDYWRRDAAVKSWFYDFPPAGRRRAQYRRGARLLSCRSWPHGRGGKLSPADGRAVDGCGWLS